MCIRTPFLSVQSREPPAVGSRLPAASSSGEARADRAASRLRARSLPLERGLEQGHRVHEQVMHRGLALGDGLDERHATSTAPAPLVDPVARGCSGSGPRPYRRPGPRSRRHASTTGCEPPTVNAAVPASASWARAPGTGTRIRGHVGEPSIAANSRRTPDGPRRPVIECRRLCRRTAGRHP